MKTRIALAFVLFASIAFGRTVSTGTFICNPGTVVSVPLVADDLSDVAVASFTINYDATVAVCLGVDAGAAVDASRFTYANTGAGQIILLAPALAAPSGTIARLRFLVREGTQGLFSDVTIAEADLAAKDGVTDLSAKSPTTTVNGMIRVLGKSADVSKLEESFVVWSKTELKSLKLEKGDGIMASDDCGAIRVSDSVVAADPIPVSKPLNGWQTGRYAILTTPTEGLAFTFEAATNETVLATSSKEGGLTTYWAEVEVEGEISVRPEEGTLPAETIAQIRGALEDELKSHPEVKTIVVKGDPVEIPLIVDLVIVPSSIISGETATLVYTKPELSITSFDPKTGLVRIKVTPGTGTSIRSALITGCVHVYGTDDLRKKMQYVSGTKYDLTPYLKTETKGEANLTVALGTHTFIKVKVETTIKQEGDNE